MKKLKYLLLLIPLLFISKVDAAIYENVNAGLSSFNYNWCSFNLSSSSGPTSLSCNYISVPTGSFDSWTTDSTYDSRPRALAGFNFQTQGIDSERFYNGEDYTLIMTIKLQGVTDIGNIKYNLHGGSSYNTTSNNVNILSTNISKNDNNYYTVTINFSPTVTFQYLTVIANNELSNGLIYSADNTPTKYFIGSNVNMSIGLDDYNITRYISDEKEIINQNNQNNQKLIEELKKGQLTCGYNYKEEFKYSNLQKQGAIVGGVVETNSNFRYSDPTIIFGGYEYEVSGYNTGSSYQYLISVYDDEMNYLFDFNYKNNTVLNLSSYDGILYIIANVNNNSKNNLVIVQKNGICVPTSYLQMKQNQETNDKLNDLNSSLNNSNSSGATNDASNFFSNFTTDTFGLTSIITAPLSLINTITSSSCSSLRLPLPYLDNKFLDLPCMNSIYSNYFGSFFNLYQTITFGIVAYWVIVRIFNQVKDFKNPEHDEIEVLDL